MTDDDFKEVIDSLVEEGYATVQVLDNEKCIVLTEKGWDYAVGIESEDLRDALGVPEEWTRG